MPAMHRTIAKARKRGQYLKTFRRLNSNMNKTPFNATDGSCNGQTSELHHLWCGHTIRVAGDIEGVEASPCRANCSHVVKALGYGVALWGQHANQTPSASSPPLDSAHLDSEHSQVSSPLKQVITEKGHLVDSRIARAPRFICIPCLKEISAATLFPFFKILEAKLLNAHPEAAVWTSTARTKAIVKLPEFEQERQRVYEVVKWRAMRAKAWGGKWGANVEFGQKQEMSVEDLSAAFEGKAAVSEDAEAEALARALGWMGVSG